MKKIVAVAPATARRRHAALRRRRPRAAAVEQPRPARGAPL